MKEPKEYESCARCGFDHEYEPESAQRAHAECVLCQIEVEEERIGDGPDHSCQAVKAWADRHELLAGEPLDFESYKACLEDAERCFGDEIHSILMDCFCPDGNPLLPYYEDSLDTYWFEF